VPLLETTRSTSPAGTVFGAAIIPPLVEWQ
jgi:hypothetical protein